MKIGKLVALESASGSSLSSRIARLERDAIRMVENGAPVEDVAGFIKGAFRNIVRQAGHIVRPIGSGQSAVGSFEEVR